MNGSAVTVVRRIPPSTWVFLVAGIGSAAWALLGAKQPMSAVIGLVLFGLAAIVRSALSEIPFELAFHDDHMRFYPGDRRVRYDDMRGIRSSPTAAERARSSYRIDVLFAEESLAIPPRLTATSAEIEEHLQKKLPPQPMPVDGKLRAYLERMIAQFGPERIWWANGTPLSPPDPMNGRLALAGLVLTVSSIVALVVLSGSSPPKSSLTICGFAIFFGVVTVLVAVVPRGVSRGSRVKGREIATVIVTPLGLALKQGDLQGEVRWDEIRDVKLIAKAPGVVIDSQNAGRAVVIAMAGATVRLRDIYDQSLERVYEQIRAFWR